MATQFWFTEETYEEFHNRSDHTEQFLAFVEEHRKELFNSNAKSCLSIGAGLGDVDTQLIKALLPAVTTYHAVEPFARHFPVLHKNIGELALERENLETHFSLTTAEDYTGPGKEVDIIFIFHSLYYIKDPERLLRRCLSWLTPGGHVMITLTDETSLVAKMEGVFNDDRSSYADDPLESIVNRVGFSNIQKFTHPNQQDYLNVGPKLVSYLLMREVNKDDIIKFQNFVRRVCGETCICHCNVQFFICQK